MVHDHMHAGLTSLTTVSRVAIVTGAVAIGTTNAITILAGWVTLGWEEEQ